MVCDQNCLKILIYKMEADVMTNTVSVEVRRGRSI
jgi:hypothetical protein